MRSRHLIHTLVCLTCAFLVGCLDFGSDTELLAPKVTAQHLQQVSSVTGIQFPDGSTGLAATKEDSRLSTFDFRPRGKDCLREKVYVNQPIRTSAAAKEVRDERPEVRGSNSWSGCAPERLNYTGLVWPGIRTGGIGNGLSKDSSWLGVRSSFDSSMAHFQVSGCPV